MGKIVKKNTFRYCDVLLKIQDVATVVTNPKYLIAIGAM